MKTLFSFVCFLILATGLFPTISTADVKRVHVIPVNKTVENGLLSFLNRSIEDAENDGADLIILDIDTPGGAVDAASEIAKSLTSTPIPTAAFVDKKALSAGAYIALNADQIYMTPGSTMGSAAVIDQHGNAAGKKAQSYWLSAMKSAAEQNNRNPKYAEAMANTKMVIPELNLKGNELLTLTPKQAEQVGYSEGTVKNLDDLLSVLGYEDAKLTYAKMSVSEQIARFLTHPLVVPILLSIGALGIVTELFTPSFGIAGSIGIASLLLFFYGHMVAGLAGMEALVLFIAGIILLLLEIVVPGGVLGLLGLGAIILSFFMSTDNNVEMGISLVIAIVVALGGAFVMMKFFKRKLTPFKKMVLNDSLNTESGYVSNQNRYELIGKQGKTTTPLRPSGTVLIDEEYVDVVTEGGYLDKDVLVNIIKVEGSRVVVRKLTEPLKKEDLN
ncbi:MULTISPECIES: NfeD family protein [Priestia]|uniref:Nodulation protein NfeD n=1 Tax=Priestia megaterium TaxID=1404 RepID=A0AAE5U950_PRIMG|nr:MULTISPECIES: nodulation protein NfeD [Priestia]RFB25342.1 nodulation protein NfeD [Bacillus sp. ALD]RFB37381.1 nodulation protein NfeD [Bacillus sp. RC]MBM6597162.1 nodulation protein NfeD [Priestia megaterium]MCR8861634.1 nodulation protein NfeD [Priestia megaterium]MDC7782413.1 nodulation protein NfeD [Priestia megaterium]